MIWVLTKVQIRKTQKAIKVCLTERWYSWEEARVAAMEDEEINLYELRYHELTILGCIRFH
jgi:hypothetical protein